MKEEKEKMVQVALKPKLTHVKIAMECSTGLK